MRALCSKRRSCSSTDGLLRTWYSWSPGLEPWLEPWLRRYSFQKVPQIYIAISCCLLFRILTFRRLSRFSRNRFWTRCRHTIIFMQNPPNQIHKNQFCNVLYTWQIRLWASCSSMLLHYHSVSIFQYNNEQKYQYIVLHRWTAEHFPKWGNAKNSC